MQAVMHGLSAAVGAIVGVVLGYYFYALPRIRRENAKLALAVDTLNKRHLKSVREVLGLTEEEEK